MRFSFLSTVVVTFATIAIAATAALACSSTSEDFRIRSVTINVQPSQPILVQRYQAPEIRIFCFGTEQVSGVSSAACPSLTTTNALVLCSRRADSPDATATCESFKEISTETQRGSINGAEMVWDLMWDGSSLSPQCFPRGVRFSYLALVRGANVSSVGLFVILLIIAIIAILLAVLSMGVFVRQRVYIFDTAGAISIAGPKGDFAGHQMQVRAGAAEDAQADYDGQVPTMFLPVTKNGDDSLYGAEMGADLTEEQRAEMRAQNAMHSASMQGPASRAVRAIAMKGASPPRPGDGIDGFEGAVRDMEMANADYDGRGRGLGGPGAFDGIGTGKYRDGPGSSIRRRRGYKPHVGGASPGDDEDGFGRGGPGGRRNKALFPTHYDFETNDGTNVGGAPFGGGRAQRDSFDRDSSGAYVDENGVAYSRDGQRLAGGAQGVRYVPQWMHAFHGRDENSDMADAFEGEPGTDGLNNSNANVSQGGPYADGSARPRGGLAPVSELGVYNRPAKKLGASRGKPVVPGEEGDETMADGYESEGNRKVRFAGEGQGGRKKTPQSGRQTPNQRRAGAGGSGNDYESASASGTGQKRRGLNGGSRGDAAANERGDHFNRNRAHAFNDSMQLGKNRDFRDRGAADSGADRVDVVRRFGEDGEDPTRTSLAEQGPRPVMQCAHCKVLLVQGRAPQFCAVSGEGHF